MAIQAQNTKLYAKLTGDATASYVEVGCIQSIGDIDLGTREIVNVDCLSSTDVDKVLGTTSLGSMDIVYTFNETEPKGNGILKTAHDATNTTKVDIKIELSNSLTETGNGTYFEFVAIVPSYKISDISKNAFIKSSVKLEMTTRPTVTSAT